MSLLSRSLFQNRKKHPIAFDQPPSRAIWLTRLEGHNSEEPFLELGPSSFVGTPDVDSCRPNKPIFFLGLGLMAFGRHGVVASAGTQK
jgi:hypothetical protein